MHRFRTHRPAALVAAALAFTVGGTALGTSAATAGESRASDLPGTAVADGFQPTSTSWTSASEGWVFGYVPCPAGSCSTLLHTTDGGRSWSESAAPDLPPSEFGNQSRIVFTERGRTGLGLATNGEVLFSSFDGGATWRQEDLGAADKIGGMGATDREAFVAVHTEAGGVVDTRFFATHLHNRRWRAVTGIHASGPGYLGGTMSEVAGDGRALQVGTASFGGVVQQWSSRNGRKFDSAAPCDGLASMHLGLAGLDHQYALCSFNPGRGEMDKELMLSADGRAFRSLGPAPRAGITSDVAVADTDTVAVGATGGDAALVHMSFDGGATWQNTLFEPDTGPVLDLDFQDSRHATFVTGYPSVGTAAVYRTTDRGLTWSPLEF